MIDGVSLEILSKVTPVLIVSALLVPLFLKIFENRGRRNIK